MSASNFHDQRPQKHNADINGQNGDLVEGKYSFITFAQRPKK